MRQFLTIDRVRRASLPGGFIILRLPSESLEKKNRALWLRGSEIVETRRPSEVKQRRVISQEDMPFVPEIFHLCVPPNKPPEPTA
jgi:hypothetical protein